jgi:recombinational DNA repair protein (RecF pathway)
LESGLKIKTVQAFSYGRPVICTKAASAGIDVEKSYHQAEDVMQVVEFTKQCINNSVLLAEMADESIRVYNRYYNTYYSNDLIEKVAAGQY